LSNQSTAFLKSATLRTTQGKYTSSWKLITTLFTSIIGFFLAMHLIGLSLQSVGTGFALDFQAALSNPAIGLFIGLLGTAILQSSSTTTSMTVAAVAVGTLSLENAIPVVMGANIGTTLTSSIVSMSYVTKTREFKKAVSAGVIHDLFNVFVCIILFPLELKFGILSKLSLYLSSAIGLSNPSNIIAEKWTLYQFTDNIGLKIISWIGAIPMLLLAFVMLFLVVKNISNILYKELIGSTKEKFESLAFKNTFKSFGWGFLLTAIIQSSSITTSLMVPLVATGKVELKRAFQFIMGANLGTTITALIAAMFKSEAAVSLAIAHFLFNSFGVILFLAFPYIRQIPILLSEKLGTFSLKYKLTAFTYIMFLFFLLPFTLIYFSKEHKTTPVTSKTTTEVTANK